MKTRLLALVVTFFAAPLLVAEKPMTPPAGPGANAGFEKLKTLVGEWKGKMDDGTEVHTSYRLISAGSAIEERLSHADMVTMYHVDGEHLMLTHYCAAHNQPRMRAAAFKDGDKTLSFTFFDATNMPDPKAMHMHNVGFIFRDSDHFTQEWTCYQDGKESRKVVFEFERVK